MAKGINLDVVKDRLEKLKKSKKASNLTWKPNDKEQTIRIVPYKHQPDNPFIELYFHYNLNGKTYLSPVSFGEPDPIMEVAQKLKNAGTKEEWKMGKQLEPKLRTFAPIIIRGRESEGVKFWGFGKTIYEDILTNIADPECGDVTDPATGRDIIVWSVKEEGKQFITPKMRIKMTQTPITNDREILQKIVKEQPDIKELWELRSYEELQDVLDRYLHPEKYENEDQSSDAGDTDGDDNNSQKESSSQETSKSDASTEDIEDAFSNLFEKD